MSGSKADELVDIGLDSLDPALHGRDSIALALQADALPSHRSELVESRPGGSPTMESPQIGPENEHLVRPQLSNKLISNSVIHW